MQNLWSENQERSAQKETLVMQYKLSFSIASISVCRGAEPKLELLLAWQIGWKFSLSLFTLLDLKERKKKNVPVTQQFSSYFHRAALYLP